MVSPMFMHQAKMGIMQRVIIMGLADAVGDQISKSIIRRVFNTHCILNHNTLAIVAHMIKLRGRINLFWVSPLLIKFGVKHRRIPVTFLGNWNMKKRVPLIIGKGPDVEVSQTIVDCQWNDISVWGGNALSAA